MRTAQERVMKMKAYGSFDEYLKDQSPKNQAIIRGLRRLVSRVEPGLSEAVKWERLLDRQSRASSVRLLRARLRAVRLL
jgi:hypothetical protein